MGDPGRLERASEAEAGMLSRLAVGVYLADILPGKTDTANILDVYLCMYAAYLGSIPVNQRE